MRTGALHKKARWRQSARKGSALEEGGKEGLRHSRGEEAGEQWCSEVQVEEQETWAGRSMRGRGGGVIDAPVEALGDARAQVLRRGHRLVCVAVAPRRPLSRPLLDLQRSTGFLQRVWEAVAGQGLAAGDGRLRNVVHLCGRRRARLVGSRNGSPDGLELRILSGLIPGSLRELGAELAPEG